MRLVLVFVFIVNLTFSQDANNTYIHDTVHSTYQDSIFVQVEQAPEFIGGFDALVKFLKENIVYPENARINGIEGKVYVSFIVSSTGKITDAKVIKGVNEEIDNEALRVVNLMPNWIPGKQKGKNISVKFTIPINFKLYNSTDKKEKKNSKK